MSILKDNVGVILSDDDDMLEKESTLDQGGGNGIWPRTNRQGGEIRSWRKYHQQASNHVQRNLRARKDTAEPFELGLLDPRSLMRLREPATHFALYYAFMDMDRPGDPFYRDKARDHVEMGQSMLDMESTQLDYDSDRSGSIDESEKSQPFPNRLIRG